MPTPVVVGIVRVGAELQQRLARVPWLGGANHEEAFAGRGAPAALDERAAAIFGTERNAVVAALPIRRNLEFERRRPAAALRRTIVGRAMLLALDIFLRQHHLALGPDASNFHRILCRRRRNA